MNTETHTTEKRNTDAPPSPSGGLKTAILITWHDYTRQVLPYELKTLDFLLSKADGYECIELVELVKP